MKTVKELFCHSTEVNRSKFITYLIPTSEYEGLHQKLKKEHTKANHIVYALRYLNEFDQIVENASDDGEPKGCAGVPTLNVLRGEELIDVAMLTIRYFGGIKLGTGGMVRAYTLSAKNVLVNALLVPYEKQSEYMFSTAYNEINRTLYKLKQLGITKYERYFGADSVDWKVMGSEEKIAKLKGL